MQSINNIRAPGLRIVVIIIFGLFIYPTWALSAEPSEVVDRFHEVNKKAKNNYNNYPQAGCPDVVN
jgi:hypothetical protein